MTLKDKLHLNRGNTANTTSTTTTTTTTNSSLNTGNSTSTSTGGKLRGLFRRNKSAPNISIQNSQGTQGIAATTYSQQSGILNQGLVTNQTNLSRVNTTQATTATTTQSTTTTAQTNQATATQESYIQKVGELQNLAPVVVEEYVEYQPIIHRVIEMPQVQRFEKHTFESVPSSGPTTVTNRPIVQETLRPFVTEEIQPIVHRTISQPYIERVEQHITERIVQPTTMTKEVINDLAPGQQQFVSAGGPLNSQGNVAGVTGAPPARQPPQPPAAARTSTVSSSSLRNI